MKMQKIQTIMLDETKFDDMFQIKEFDMRTLDVSILLHFFEKCQDDGLLKYFIDTVRDINALCKNNKMGLIHFVCKFCTTDIIKYLMNKKNVNLELEMVDRWRPIHIACRYNLTNIISLLVEKKVNLEAETVHKWRPIHFICYYCDAETIQRAAQKGVALNMCVVKDTGGPANWLPFDLLQFNDRLNKEVQVELGNMMLGLL